MKITTAILMIFFCLAGAAAHGADKAAGKSANRQYTILMPLFNIGSGAGFSISGYMAVFDQLVGIIEQELGLNVTFEFVGDADMSPQELSVAVADALARKGDFAFISHDTYQISMKKGVPIKPFYIPALNKKCLYKWCVYTLKDSSIKSAADLKGKRFAKAQSDDVREWKEFQRMGITEPADKAFEMVRVDNFQSQFYALMMDEADFAWGPDYAITLLTLTDTRFKKLRPAVCSDDYIFDAMIVYRTTVDPKIVAIAADTLESFTKNKAFAKIPYYSVFKKGGLLFQRFEDFHMKTLREQSARHAAWGKEYQEWKAANEKTKAGK